MNMISTAKVTRANAKTTGSKMHAAKKFGWNRTYSIGLGRGILVLKKVSKARPLLAQIDSYRLGMSSAFSKIDRLMQDSKSCVDHIARTTSGGYCP
eukprot:1798254-Amphidinium_carterae.1